RGPRGRSGLYDVEGRGAAIPSRLAQGAPRQPGLDRTADPGHGREGGCALPAHLRLGSGEDIRVSGTGALMKKAVRSAVSRKNRWIETGSRSTAAPPPRPGNWPPTASYSPQHPATAIHDIDRAIPALQAAVGRPLR